MIKIYEIFMTKELIQDGLFDMREHILSLMGDADMVRFTINDDIEIPVERLEILE